MGVNNKQIILLSGVLCSQNDKYLLVQEARDKPYSKCKNKWSLPQGGYDKDGESIQDLAVRELLEETGGEAKLSGRYVVVEGWETGIIIAISVIWEASNWKRLKEYKNDEITSTKFFTINELRELFSESKIRDGFPILELIYTFKTGSLDTLHWKILRK